MKQHKFRTLKAAQRKAKAMKRAYGYTPSVFKVTKKSAGIKFFAVIQPKGLKKIRR